MTKFRPHRGTLADAMAECVPCYSISQLIEICNLLLQPYDIRCEELTVTPYCYDKRIHWDTYIVVLEGYGVLGFTDGP